VLRRPSEATINFSERQSDMLNIYDVISVHNNKILPIFAESGQVHTVQALKRLTNSARAALLNGERLTRAGSLQMQNKIKDDCQRMVNSFHHLGAAGLSTEHDPGRLLENMQSYLIDSWQRSVLALDVLRQRGDIFLEHEAAGCPPVLTYQYEVVLDGKDLPRPCNYVLLHIVPPQDVTVDATHRPYVIIDPRAGHGAGIGGFKKDSQVGAALRAGHPVYFVSFTRDPQPDQTLADVTRAEAEFVREVSRRHPEAPKPAVIRNCQGGWATLLLAATNPDLTGPIVLNGSPVSTWSGTVGANPMRYHGGLFGGTWQAMFWSDIGNGLFDGAHLVTNFELLNPSRNYFRKYFDLYEKADTEGPRFLEFDTWWGGYFLMNKAEIHWIIEQLFVGNRLSKNEARLEPGRNIDLKNIRSPIIVFTSYGDNITPPQQALNWIVDTYADVSEIKSRGQRIVYMVHNEVGHLGIFVSSKIAKREHTEVASTMDTIEALPPGLYEMKIEDFKGDGAHRTFTVSFHERTFDDIRAIDDGRNDEIAFAAVARASEYQAEQYDVHLRPLVRACVHRATGELLRALHPMRTQRALFSSRNPIVSALPKLAKQVRAGRQPAAADNPFLAIERTWADLVEQTMDLGRDLRDTCYETMFYGIWGAPWAREFGQRHQVRRTLKNKAELRALAEVQYAIRNMAEGGFVDAVIRMLVLLAESRGNVRRDRLERSAHLLTGSEPFRSLTSEQRERIIEQQTLLVQFEPEGAIETLPRLLKTADQRALAAEVVQYVPGLIGEMAPQTFEMVQRFRRVLGLPPRTTDVLENPLDALKPASLTLLRTSPQGIEADTATREPARTAVAAVLAQENAVWPAKTSSTTN
jgi:pimeloyl-ACP methyl ester carboxylesterase